jgi:Uma2 family endonuclease
MTQILINLKPLLNLNAEQFDQLCQANPDLQFERTAQGELIIVTPVGGESGSQEAMLIAKLWYWNDQNKLGEVFSSSTIFRLPNGADRSPDAAWIAQERWNSLSREEQKRFPPICPDFVIELRSSSDRLKILQDKMQEYLDNGLRLGWLIDPSRQMVEIYRPEKEVEAIAIPAILSGESVLSGFILTLP